MRGSLFSHFKSITAVALGVGYLLLAACGGSGGGLVADGGIGGSGIVSSGSVTQLGSIFVNGIEFRVQGSSFQREGEAPEILDEIQSQIAPGMVVEVEGTLDVNGTSGAATSVRYADIVEGQIDSLVFQGPGVKLLSILGQEVVVEDGLTRFASGLDFATIEASAGFLEVSGYRRADGLVQATYLETRVPGRLEVKGRVEVVNATTFSLAGLTVNYSGTPSLANGSLVEVKGTSYDVATQILLASSVESIPAGLGMVSAGRAEVEGFVSLLSGTSVSAGEVFLVDGQPVSFSAQTLFIGGVASDLDGAVKVEAEGRLSGGVLAASRIQFKENLRFETTVLNVDGNGLTLGYPDGATIDAQVEDRVTEGAEQLAGLSVGSYVRVRGIQLAAGGGGIVLATELRVETPDDRFTLQGPVAQFSATAGADQLTILGVTIDTSGFADSQFKDSAAVIGRSAFYAALAVDSNLLVKFRGDGLQSSHPVWNQVEIER